MLPTPAQWFSGVSLRILPLYIRVRWQRPARIPDHILANVLRGAFNITFRRLVCPPEWIDHACPPCPLYGQCPYGRLFEPTPGTDSSRLRLQSDLPRPFVLKPPLESAAHPPLPRFGGEGPGVNGASESRPLDKVRRATPPSDRLEFGLVLFGTAIDHLPHFVVTLAELGRVGMGPDRIPFTVESVSARFAFGFTDDAHSEPLYHPATHTFLPPPRTLAMANLLAKPRAAEGNATAASLTLRFLTPTLIRTGSGVDPRGERIPAREVRDRPEFGVLVRRLRDRLSSLCAFFGEAPWQGPDFAEIGRLADTVRLVHSRTEWTHRSRQSTRTGQSHELSGFVGHATYEFESEDHKSLFLPLLKAGQLLHLGKHSVWGNGWIQVANDTDW